MPKSTTKRSAVVDSSLKGLEQRHRALLAELANIGLVLRGTIAPRRMRCGNPTCRCRAHPPQLHGPYFVWTRKVAGKTVTAMLPRYQATLCQDWSRNMRKLDRIVRQLQALGLRAAALVRGADGAAKPAV
jgi:hypothetical protein